MAPPDTRLARRRLVAQGVAGPDSSGSRADQSPTRAASVVLAASRQLATQAQDLASGVGALALRSTGLHADVEAALNAGAIVRSWPMRGTLFLVAAADARWLTELLAPRSYRQAAGVWRTAGLGEPEFARAASIAREILGGGRALPRADVFAAFEAGGLALGGGRGPLLLKRLAGDALIVLGPLVGAQQAVVLLDDWAGDARPRDREDALRELAVRYVAGHGPATVHDLAWWSGLTVTDARRAVELAGDAIEREEIGGVTFLVAAAGHPALSLSPSPGAEAVAAPGDVRLLPSFDELLLGYRDRSASMTPETFARVTPSSNGLFLPVVTVDGRAVGTWRRTLVGSAALEVATDLFEPVSAAVEAAIRRRSHEFAVSLGRELV